MFIMCRLCLGKRCNNDHFTVSLWYFYISCLFRTHLNSPCDIYPFLVISYLSSTSYKIFYTLQINTGVQKASPHLLNHSSCNTNLKLINNTQTDDTTCNVGMNENIASYSYYPSYFQSIVDINRRNSSQCSKLN